MNEDITIELNIGLLDTDVLEKIKEQLVLQGRYDDASKVRAFIKCTCVLELIKEAGK